MVEIRRISVGSALKVGAIVSALCFAIFGFLMLGFEGVLFGLFRGESQTSGNSAFSIGGAGISTLCISYFVGIVFAVIFGAIGAAIGAFVYNLAAGWVGGLELQLGQVGQVRAVPPPNTSAPLA